ncbi:hypothetical protein ABBQ32_001690 [Trebouxia sp. C0010 RCD-2024]
MQDHHNAEIALLEANVMNNRHAEVWGYLAFLALHMDQEPEAEQALTWAHKCGLSNVQLLDEIGERYITMGRYNKAKDVLQSSINVRDLPHAHWLLGDALYELGELSQAELHYHAVQVDAASKAERMHSLQQLVHIFKKQGDTERAANCTSELQGLHG